MRFSFFPGFINLFMLAVLAFDFAAHIGSGSVEASMRGGVFKVVLFLGALSASLCIHLQAHKPKGGGCLIYPLSSFLSLVILGLLPCLDHLSLFLPLNGFVSIKAMVEGKALIGYKVLVSHFSLLYFGPHPPCFCFFHHVCG